MIKHDWIIKEITPNILHIEDYKGVHATLVKGDKMAVLWDTGYGFYNLKSLISELINVPVIVLLSHGHPDHILGSYQFEEVYLNNKDLKLVNNFNYRYSKKMLAKKIKDKELFNKEQYKQYLKTSLPSFKDLNDGDTFDLGKLHVRAVSLESHTPGSMGLLIEEEKILLTGDVICNDLWLFLPESLSIKKTTETMKKIENLPFDYYLPSHQAKLFPKENIKNIIYHLETLNIKTSVFKKLFGIYNVYESHYETPYGNSIILYNKSKLKN